MTSSTHKTPSELSQESHERHFNDPESGLWLNMSSKPKAEASEAKENEGAEQGAVADQTLGRELVETLEQTTIAGEVSEDETEELEYPAMGMGDQKPKILLMGLKRSGKTSIANVVLRKVLPHETIHLETTTAIAKTTMNSFMDFRLWDLPAQIDYFDGNFDSDSIFSGVGGIIWVIDVGDTYELTASRLTDTIVRLSEVYPEIKYSVFCHKTDSISEDIVSDIVTEIIQNISDDLFDAGIEHPMLNHYSTSIFDHTVFEAFSKVVQGLVPQLGTYEALLDNLQASCRFEKVYLMDVRSRIYIASDTKPNNVKAYECCSDYIGTVVDVVDLFDYDRKKNDTSKRAKDIASTPTEAITTFGSYTVLLRELNPFLAVVGVSHEPTFFAERAMVNHNVQKFSDAISKVIVRK